MMFLPNILRIANLAGFAVFSEWRANLVRFANWRLSILPETIMTTATQQNTQNTVNAPRSLMLIGGKAVESSDGRFIDIENPATRAVIAQVPRGTDADVDAAVRAAAAAFEGWKRVT